MNYLCIDDVNFLERSDSVLPYELDCIYDGISSINLIEASLHFTNKINQYYWIDSKYNRIDCNGETRLWSTYRMNFTFTTQQECDRNTNRLPGFRKGAKCIISKNFLRTNMFRTNRFLLETRSDLYPIPFSFEIRYACN